MPQAIAAMSTKFLMLRILDRVGYRGVLTSNTVMLGLLLMLFATVGIGTPLWIIVLQAFCYGALTSLQYTSMNTLVYADIPEDMTSNAGSIASTLQQMSISFGVAAAVLTTALFITDRFRSNPGEMIEKRGRRQCEPAKRPSPRMMIISTTADSPGFLRVILDQQFPRPNFNKILVR
jgi:MFS family permease